MVEFYRQFGVPSRLKQRIKLYNHVYLGDAGMIAGFVIAISQGQSLPFFYNDASKMPFYIYAVDMAVACIYLLIHPRSNPGKSNAQLLMMTFIHTTRFYQSINAFQDYYRVKCPMLDNDMPRWMNHRLPVNVKYLYHSDDDEKDKKIRSEK